MGIRGPEENKPVFKYNTNTNTQLFKYKNTNIVSGNQRLGKKTLFRSDAMRSKTFSWLLNMSLISVEPSYREQASVNLKCFWKNLYIISSTFPFFFSAKKMIFWERENSADRAVDGAAEEKEGAGKRKFETANQSCQQSEVEDFKIYLYINFRFWKKIFGKPYRI